MYPSEFYKMKNFANPKTMFKSCSNNEEFSTKPVAIGTTNNKKAKTASEKIKPSEKANKDSEKANSGNKSSEKTSEKTNKANKASEKADKPNKSSEKANKSNKPSEKANQLSEKGNMASEKAKKTSHSSGSGSDRSGSGCSGSIGSSGSSSASYKSVLNASCCSGESNVCSPVSTPRSEVSGCSTDAAYMTALGASDGASSDTVSNGAMDVSEKEQLPREPHHPLHSEWTLWYLETDRSKSWEEMLHEVASFNTVENFWSLINHIKTPSEIKTGSDYCLFKKGIRPMWEDEANVRGGRWIISLNRGNKNDLDNFWLDTMLVLIGESCDYSQELCGAVVNIRGKNNKISIWTANGNDEAAALEIGSKLREGLRMDSVYLLQYQLHKDTMAKQGSLVKTIYTR